MDPEADHEVPGLTGALRRVLDDPAHRDAAAVRQTLLDRGWRPPQRSHPSAQVRTGARPDATVVELMARGCSAQETAALLGVSLAALADQLAHLRSAYGCTSTAEALRRARAAAGAPGEH